jgi:imidazolonepropionase-like amidohydrolase
MSPMEAIMAGTKFGGQIMGMGDELGQLKQGWLADMILVDGDPISNIRVLQDKSRILAIMKDGKFHKEPKMNAQTRRLTA